MSGIILLFFLFLPFPAWADPSPLSLQYALARELELGRGSVSEAASRYLQMLPEALASDSALAAQVLFRIGVCERELGRPTEARQVWRQLIETYPADHPLVAKAREEVKEVEREVGRITIRGRAVDAAGQPLPGVYVMVGDWGNAPPLIAGPDGTFQAVRQAAGRLANGDRYGLVYAEHPVWPLSMAAVWRESSSPSPDILLHPVLSLAGYVVDPRGRPVVSATLRVTAFADGATEVPMSLGRFLPPAHTGTNGQFRINGLPEGRRYGISAEKEGYRTGRSTADGSVIKPNRESVTEDGLDARVIYAPEIVLLPVGRIAVDESGILRAEVNLNDPAERARLEEALAAFEPGRKGNGENGPRAALASNRFPYADFPFELRWLRGDAAADSPLNADDLEGQIVVYHFSSAYLDASLKRQFPGEPGSISQIAKLFGRQGVLCVWILPAADGVEDAARLALETCADIPIAVDQNGRLGKVMGVMGYGGNVVVGRDGMMRPACPDQQLFRVLKGVLSP